MLPLVTEFSIILSEFSLIFPGGGGGVTPPRSNAPGHRQARPAEAALVLTNPSYNYTIARAYQCYNLRRQPFRTL